MITIDSYRVAFWRSVNAGLAARGREEATFGQIEYCYRRGWTANEAAEILAPHQEASEEAILAFGAFVVAPQLQEGARS